MAELSAAWIGWTIKRFYASTRHKIFSPIGLLFEDEAAHGSGNILGYLVLKQSLGFHLNKQFQNMVF
jgi:hypothetical protein